MGLSRDLALEAGIGFRTSGSLELIPFRHVGRFLDAVGARGEVILGIEAFTLVEDKVIPDPLAIADYSSHPRSRDAVDLTLRSAKQFIEICGRPEHYFEFTFRRR